MNLTTLTHEQLLPLWADGEIDLAGWNQPEEATTLPNGLKVIRNVSHPSMTAYLPAPANANGCAVIICPGGAYHFVAYDHEGIRVAQWLNARGYTTFVLKYRLVQTGDDFPDCVGRHLDDPQQKAALVEPIWPLMTADGCQAVRLVRAHAADWNLDPWKIGMLGFSAGGMLTLNVALNSDEFSRPDFAAPIYSAPPPAAPVPKDAPPLFLLCAANDNMASEVSTEYYARWRSARRPVELHIYAQGGHGFGMNPQGLPSDDWIERLAEWLEGTIFSSRP